MKYAISLSTNILKELNISEITNIIDKYNPNKIINGIEISTSNSYELNKIAEYTKIKGMDFQCHLPNLENMKDIKEYLDNINEISKTINKKITIVIHSISNEEINQSIKLTKEYVLEILNYIKNNNYNINISLENLNVFQGVKRINNQEIDNILTDINEISFTYDVGHDLYDNKKISELSKIQTNKLNNIHIHDIKNIQDHHEITINSNYLSELKKSINNLKNINYQNNIVLEYIIDYLEGDNTSEKFEYYIKSFNTIFKILEED